MKKFFLFFFAFTAFCGVNAAPKESDAYTVDPGLIQNRIFFHKPNRMKLFNSLVWHYDRKKSLRSFDGTLNDDVISAVVSAKAQYVIADLNKVSVSQVKAAQQAGLKVILGPVRNINDATAAALLEPYGAYTVDDVYYTTIRQELDNTDPASIKPFGEVVPLSYADGTDELAPQTSRRAAGTNLRILSYNILAGLWSHKPRVAPRADDVAAVIKKIAPDIAGLQEVDQEWYSELKSKLHPYRFVRMTDSKRQGKVTCNIIYDPRRFKQITGGLLPYTDNWLRCFHWALFEERKGKRRFIVTNTHWDLTSAKRMKNAKLMREFVQDLVRRYRCPVISTGDFNCETDTPEFTAFASHVKMFDAMEIAHRVKNKFVGSAYDIRFINAPLRKKHIDHILCTDQFKVLSAELVVHPCLLSCSDHFPLIADLK